MSESTISRAPEVETHPSASRVVIYHKLTHKSVVLNPVGSWIWEQLDVPCTEEQLLKKMSQQFPDVEVELLQSDLAEYLGELDSNQLIHR